MILISNCKYSCVSICNRIMINIHIKWYQSQIDNMQLPNEFCEVYISYCALIWWNPEFFVISIIIRQTNILKQYKQKPNNGIIKKIHS